MLTLRRFAPRHAAFVIALTLAVSACGSEGTTPLGDAAAGDLGVLDAGPRDAGAGDASEARDATADAAAEDALPNDAAPDATPTDALPNDAAPDATPTDALPSDAAPDASAADASAADAAPPDAGFTPPAVRWVAEQSPTLRWLYSFGLAPLTDGVLVAGTFIEGATLGATSLDGHGCVHSFVARYSATGTLAWAREAGGSRQDMGTCLDTTWGRGIAAAPDGSSVLVGYFDGLVDVGGHVMSSNALVSFAARYDASGSALWAVPFAPGHANGVAVLPDGSSIVVGYFEGNAAIGPTTLMTAGLGDVLIVRLDPNGSIVWAKRAGSANHDEATAVAAYPDGSFVVVGSIQGAATFGDAPNAQHVGAAGGVDLFVARYDADGACVWATSAGGSDEDLASAVAILTDGSVLVGGHASSGIRFGSDTLTTAGQPDLLLARYTDAGALTWGRIYGGIGGDTIDGVAALPDGTALVSGRIYGTLTLAGSTIGTANSYDGVVARIDADGTPLWAAHEGGAGDDECPAVALGPDGQAIYLACDLGHGADEVGFGPPATPVTASHESDSFLICGQP